MESDEVKGERGPIAANVSGPSRLPAKGSQYAPNPHRFCQFIPWPCTAAIPPMVAEVPSDGTEPGSEGGRAEDSGQQARCGCPPPFFYQRCFV